MTSGGAAWSRAIVTPSPTCRAREKFPLNATHGENSLGEESTGSQCIHQKKRYQRLHIYRRKSETSHSAPDALGSTCRKQTPQGGLPGDCEPVSNQRRPTLSPNSDACIENPEAPPDRDQEPTLHPHPPGPEGTELQCRSDTQATLCLAQVVATPRSPPVGLSASLK
ncbi:hypothetical protein NDU88_001781 [Pleurodeles waltl]|uniref:Uncharacterized protein n=1 Tax=Pleurodeles waltl TaxID=8319 RepID=A0AAV7U7Z1_PLEWA|nr:hypothetical protein NDU88_001781 [Pleurodeles waltl]